MATRRALDNDLPDAPVMEPGVAICTGITAAPELVCTDVTCGVTVAVLARTVGLATDADGCDGFTPSAVRPFWDNARRLSNAAARDERGVAVLFSIASFMLLSFRIRQTLTRVNSCEGPLLDSLFQIYLVTLLNDRETLQRSYPDSESNCHNQSGARDY